MHELVIQRLKKISILEEIKDNEEFMQAFLKICKLKEYRQGEVIIKEGEMGTEMFIVIQGEVEIRKKTRAGDNFTVVTLNAKHNIFFGEMALIDDDTRSATVLANLNSEFLVINKDNFHKLGKKSPEIVLPITHSIAKILAGRLRKTTLDMITLFDALVTEIKN